MAFIHTPNIGGIGILKDREDFDLPLGAWSGGQNVRFKASRAIKMKGDVEVYATGNPAATPLWGFPWRSQGILYWVYATPTKIYRASTGTHEDITRSSGPYNAQNDTTFSGGVFNGVPVVNNDSLNDYPQQWDASSVEMKDMTNWPTDLYCRFLRPYKNFLVAYNLVDGGSSLPYSLQWSSVADPGTLPTSWDHTDPTVLTGRATLAKTSGQIVSAQTLKGDNIIYKDDAIVLMRFVGGQFVFNFDYLTTQHGILSPHSVATFRNNHLVVTTGDVVIHNGNIPETIITNKNRKFLFSSMNPNHIDKTFVVPNYNENELWICYVSEQEDPAAVFPNMALVWDWGEDTWTYRQLNDFAFANYGVVDDVGGGGSGDIWDNQDYSWDSDSEVWGDQLFNPAKLRMLAFQPSTGKLLQLEETQQFDGTPYTASIERLGMPMFAEQDNQEGEIEVTRNKFIRRVYPIIEGSGPLQIDLGVQRIVGGAIDWYGPFTFDPDSERYIDLRMNGKYVAIQIKSQTSVDWQFFGMEIDYIPMGEAVR